MSPWAAHRHRADELRGRYPFASEVLDFYLALLDVWQDAYDAAVAARPDPAGLAGWAADRVLPGVVKAAEAAGPPALAASAGDVDAEHALPAWLAGSGLPPVERFLARASLTAPLIALGDAAGAACAGDPGPRDARHCPRCGGPAQLSVRADGQDHLVRGQRRLICARCAHGWAYSSSACPACGETAGAKRTVYSEEHPGPIVRHDQSDVTFPHLRIEACAACQRYLIDVDLGRDNRAVPEVDELAALPLDLYATDQGLSKITPNLMGF